MKESVTKFDLESAFKALDEIDIPVADKGIKANRPALTEIFSRKSKFDALFEEYYDVGSQEELGEAQEAREAEIAQAKLARIEKIVDLDAESPEDLLTTYVGKYIMQCPQCMTLFYKDKEDIVESEEDPNTVNVSEICQHCGNESGYTLVGKVGEAEADETAEMPAEESTDGEELDLDLPTEETSEEASDELDIDAAELDELDLNIEEDEAGEEEKKEEAFVAHTGETLVEEVTDDADLDAKLEAHTEYIEYLRTMISQEEAALEKTENAQVRAAIQRRLDAFKEDLEAALPDAVKNDEAITEEPVEETSVEMEEVTETEEVSESLTEALHEDTELEVSADEFEELINSPEFKKPVSDTAARAMINAEKEDEDETVEEELSTDSENLEEGIFDKLKDKIANTFDQLGRKLKTREAKADWVLANASTDKYASAKFKKGKLEPDTFARRFNKYIVIGYKNKFSNDKAITQVPEPTNKNLVPAKSSAGDTYKQADDAAKGWSMQSENGPAFIYLAKNAEGEDSLFLCQYFDGKLHTDNVEKYFNIIKDDLKGAALEARGKMASSDGEEVTEEVKTKEVKVSELAVGMKLKLADGIGEITKIDAARLSGHKTITVKINDKEEAITLNLEAEVLVVVEQAEPGDDGGYDADHLEASLERPSGLSIIMEQLDEIQESSLERLIADSLIEAYGNVAGYRLSGCEYLDEKLNVDGTIYFTSGKTRKTTYTFSEAYLEDSKAKLCGLNEKLGLDKQFTLTGKIDETNKTFITESFNCNK